MLKNSKLITCILPKGSARALSEKLWLDKKLNSVNDQDARRITTLTESTHKAIAMENEVLTVIVAEEDADEIFEFIYYEAKVYEPNGSIIYMTNLVESNLFTLPHLPRES